MGGKLAIIVPDLILGIDFGVVDSNASRGFIRIKDKYFIYETSAIKLCNRMILSTLVTYKIEFQV
jgi:hypothetical protein